MAIVTIGRPAYFFVLFVDEDNVPIDVVTASLHLFTFDEGAKLILLNEVPMTPTGETGKFIYSYLVPDDWNHDSNLYAHMRGEEANGTKYLTEQHFDLWTVDGTPYRKPPPPPPMSHWNTDDGANEGAGFVTHSALNFAMAYIPTSSGGAGNPLYSDSWATTIQSRVTRTNSVTIEAGGFLTGFGGDSSFVLSVQTENTTVFTHVFPATSNGFQNAPNNIASVEITDFQDDEQGRKKANLVATVDLDTLANTLNLKGMKISITTTHITDSTSDGGGSYPHTVDYFYYDRNDETPHISEVIFEETLRVIRHISGIAYYDTTSTFRIRVLGIDHLNDASAKPSHNLVIEASGIDLPDLEQSPFGLGAQYFTGWTSDENSTDASYDKGDWTLLEPNYRAIGIDMSASAMARDTWGSSATVSSPLKPILVDTYNPTSTSQFDGFDDEEHRMQSDYVTAWDSGHHLTVGEALVQGGKLQCPHTDWSPYFPLDPMPNPNYTGITQSSSYYRVFDVTDNGTVSHSNINFTIQGDFVVGLEQDLVNGDLQIFVRRKQSLNGSSGTASAPLNVHGTAYNHTLFDDGVTNAQIREFVVGDTVSLTFGGYAVREGVYVEIRITNPLVKLNSFLVSFLG